MVEPMALPPHMHRETTRHGKAVFYVRVGKGKRNRISAEYGTPEFFAAYRAALEGSADAPVTTAGRGSVKWLIDRYRGSSAWAKLSSATRRQRELIFAKVEAKAAGAPYGQVTRKKIWQAREDQRNTPFAANNFLKAMRGLFAWAVEAELIDENPAAAVNFLPTETEGHAAWTMTDVAAYEAQWPEGTREQVWLHVLLFTGLRLGDATVIGWQHVRDGCASLRAEKTGVELNIEIDPRLRKTLEAGPTGDLAWISNSWGRPFVKEAFGNAFRKACLMAGIKGKSAHGLRKLRAAQAAEDGVTGEEMDAYFGWQSNRMSKLYTRSASRKRLARMAASKMQSGNEIRPHLNPERPHLLENSTKSTVKK